MLKILYAASNSFNSGIQLSRFLDAIKDKSYQIKIAAYKKSYPYNAQVDWTLDALLNFFSPERLRLENNDNLKIYYDQIKYFNPDLIISDLEFFTSYIATLLNIKLWQYSDSLLQFALNNKGKLGLFNKYSYLYFRFYDQNQRFVNVIDNSNENFICSHFGDFPNRPKLKNNFKWIRPYHYMGNDYKPCQHNIVSVVDSKKAINLLTHQNDVVNFNIFPNEFYKNIESKNYYDHLEYACNIYNSNYFFCEGHSSFLADAFYNKKHSYIITDLNDLNCITNTEISKIYDVGDQVINNIELKNQNINVTTYRNDISFLHEKLEEL